MARFASILSITILSLFVITALTVVRYLYVRSTDLENTAIKLQADLSSVEVGLQKAEERTSNLRKSALDFVRKPFDEFSDVGEKQFIVKELLRNEMDGQYILVGTIWSTDGGTAGVSGRFQVGEFLITKYGAQFDIAILTKQDYPPPGGFALNRDTGTITANWQGNRKVKLLLWRCNE